MSRHCQLSSEAWIIKVELFVFHSKRKYFFSCTTENKHKWINTFLFIPEAHFIFGYKLISLQKQIDKTSLLLVLGSLTSAMRSIVSDSKSWPKWCINHNGWEKTPEKNRGCFFFFKYTADHKICLWNWIVNRLKNVFLIASRWCVACVTRRKSWASIVN